MQEDSISLNKFISMSGVCSRREADKWIEAGRVKINGETARKGNRVFPGDSVTVDGKPVRHTEKPVYIMYNKPLGVTCTTDRRDKSNIIDRIGHQQRIFPIGRLDKNSHGLILLTNNGDIVNEILRVENKHEKEYIVKVDRPITKEFLKGMQSGVPVLGTVTNPCTVIQRGENRFKIILNQGLNRQIRRMCEYFGYKVVNLKRVRIMHLKLDGLELGQWRDLNEEELGELMEQLGEEKD